ncbi:hypothetical protein C9J85_18730 [Haloferax sp. wsp5]|nr:hypothetical protein C9J85_18730 [Haloferax sp. wsp5]
MLEIHRLNTGAVITRLTTTDWSLVRSGRSYRSACAVVYTERVQTVRRREDSQLHQPRVGPVRISPACVNGTSYHDPRNRSVRSMCTSAGIECGVPRCDRRVEPP